MNHLEGYNSFGNNTLSEDLLYHIENKISLFENFNMRTMIIRHKNFGEIVVDLEGNSIKNVENTSRSNFPFNIGSYWNRSIYTWSCNNHFETIETLINNKLVKTEKTCPDKKIFGIKTKDIPRGHEWRTIFPNKFK